MVAGVRTFKRSLHVQVVPLCKHCVNVRLSSFADSCKEESQAHTSLWVNVEHDRRPMQICVRRCPMEVNVETVFVQLFVKKCLPMGCTGMCVNSAQLQVQFWGLISIPYDSSRRPWLVIVFCGASCCLFCDAA